MKSKSFKRVLSVGMLGALALSVVSCGGSEPTTTPSGIGSTTSGTGSSFNPKNETEALIMASQDVDKVFNPFYSSSAADGSVIGMTQIGMLGNDSKGNVTTAKDGDAVVVYDYESKYDKASDTTTYKFVLRNDVRFSNNTPLTMKDVLFNLYVYLDPVYAGSSTIYSTDIVGLKAYRTQQSTENEQDSYREQFETVAYQRIANLVQAADYVNDEHKDDNEPLTIDSFRGYLEDYVKENGANYADVVADYDKAIELFKEEIDTDWNNSKDSWQDISFIAKRKDDYGNKIEYKSDPKDTTTPDDKRFKTDVEVFLYMEGFIKWNAKDEVLEAKTAYDYREYRDLTEQEAKDLVINATIPSSISAVVQWYQTSNTLYEYIVNDAMEKATSGVGQLQYSNISGIKFANRTEAVTVNGVTYPAMDNNYEADGTVKDGYNEVLSITINKVDPKAIWNFAFAVAPMYYYSNQEEIEKFDYESHFGVTYSSQTFQQNVIKDKDKIGVPVGAGAYQAVNKDGSKDNVTAGGFFDGTTIYYTRNDYFIDPVTKTYATIKNIRFRIVPTTGLTNALYTKEVDYCEPNAKPETSAELATKRSEGIGKQEVKTSGYGYIGVNAGKVEKLTVRQAIMHSIDTQEVVNYYGTSAEAIYRSMSKENWAYPTGCSSYYPYIGGKIPSDLDAVSPNYKYYVTEVLGKTSGEELTEDEQKAFIDYLIGDLGGVAKDSYGNYDGLVYTFTIAGASEDHPAFAAMSHAAEFLNNIGMQITVSKDSNALTKLTTGALDVWAAAWGSTIDPDMYQVYHKESKANSIKNWGYPEILRNKSKYPEENDIIDELSDLIEAGRETENQEMRKNIYSQALDLVMELAVELPTYQRTDLFAYNINKIQESTLNLTDLTSYKGLTSSLWTVSLTK